MKIPFHKYGPNEKAELQALLERFSPLGTTTPAAVLEFFQLQNPRRFHLAVFDASIRCDVAARLVPWWSFWFSHASWMINFLFDQQLENAPHLEHSMTISEMKARGYLPDQWKQATLVEIELRYYDVSW